MHNRLQMALAYRVDPAQRLVTITGEYANAAEWLKLAGKVLRDKQVEAGFGFLRDLRGATRVPDTSMVVSAFQVVQRFWPSVTPLKAAILTDRDDNSVANVAQALADGHNLPIRVFTTYEEAIEWLNGHSS